MMRLLAGLTAAACLMAAAADDADVTAMDRRWADATMRADEGALKQLLASDLVYIHGDGKVETKAEFIARVTSRGIQYKKIEFAGVRTKRIGDVAITHSRPDVVVHRDGRDSPFRGWYTHIWALRDGRWQMIAHQATPDAK